MRHSTASVIVGIAATFMLAAWCVCPARAQSPSVPTGGPNRIGKIDITASSSVFSQGVIIYKHVQMQSQGGTTLSADELRATLTKTGTGVVGVVLTGHVHAYLQQISEGRTIDITTGKAVYHPKANRIDLSGGVKAVATTPYTVGPLVQTSNTGYIQLGKAPDYPQIVMNADIHMTFTPNQ